MPINYLRTLTASARTQRANRHLGISLAFIAGAINAGGFIAVGRYTSHMTGIVSELADDLVLGQLALAGAALMALLTFIAGAATSAMLIHWGHRQQLRSEYAPPLMLEAGLLLLFGLMGANLMASQALLVPLAVITLCFIMGLQNAIITKLSNAEIRTTHVTGVVTDIGIELGKLMYWNRTLMDDSRRVVANRERLRIHVSLLLAFFGGGVAGALGFKHWGFIATVPLALYLLILAAIPLLDQWRRH